MDIDEEEYVQAVKEHGSADAAVSVSLKHAGFLQNPRTFVRRFCLVDVGGTRPTAIMDLNTGQWTHFHPPFEGVVPELQGNPERDQSLRDSIKYISYSRQHPDD